MDAITIFNAVKSGLLKFIIGVIILFLGFIIGKFIGTLLTRILQEAGLDEALEHIGVEIQLSKLLGRLAAFAIYVTAVVLFFNQLGITGIVWVVLSIFAGILIAISLILGTKDFIYNFFVGLYIKKRILRKKYLEFNGKKCRIIAAGYTGVEVQKGKDKLIIPYGGLMEKD